MFSPDRGTIKEGFVQVGNLAATGRLRNTLTIGLSFVQLLRKTKREVAGTRVLIISFSDRVVFLEKGVASDSYIQVALIVTVHCSGYSVL